MVDLKRRQKIKKAIIGGAGLLLGLGFLKSVWADIILRDKSSGNQYQFGTNADFGDADLTSIAKLEGIDAEIYLDMGTDGQLNLVADTTMNLGSTVTNLNLGNLAVTTANIATGATTANFGPVDDIVLGSSGKKVGFYGNVGAVIDTGWTTFANLTTDRTCDADATSVAELADILGTLIEKLKALNLISA